MPARDLLVYAGKSAQEASAPAQFPDDIRWSFSRFHTTRPEIRIGWEQFIAPRALRQHQVDVIHAPVNVLPLRTEVPGVVTIHDLAFLVYPDQYPGMKQRYLSELTKRSVHNAARVITVSEHTRRDVISWYDVDPDKVVAIPNGLDPSMKVPVTSEAVEIFRREQGLPADFILFVGTLQPRKNLRGLLDAYSRIHLDQRPPLYIAGGSGWMYSDVYQQVQHLGIIEDVHFPGYVSPEDLRLWYSAATVFVYPSFYEGFGLPVLEAMACGTAVITSQTSSLPEVIGDAGLLIDPDNPDDIAHAIERLLDDSALRQQSAQRGLQRSADFTWGHTAEQTAAVYRSVVLDDK